MSSSRKNQRGAASVIVYEAIKNDIIHRKLKSGAPLVEEDLAEQYQISRTPVREALKRLENDKLVTYYPYRGCFVSSFGRHDIVEIYTVRMALECACCREIVESGKITPLVIAELEKEQRLAEEFLTQGDIDSALPHSDHIHQTIVDLTGNGRMRWMVDQMKAQCQYFDDVAVNGAGLLPRSVGEHGNIIRALKQRDARLAEELLRSHIKGTLADVLAAVREL